MLSYDQLISLRGRIDQERNIIYNARSSILIHLKKMFESKLIDFSFVNHILEEGFNRDSHFDF